MEKTFREQYRQATGLVVDIEKVLENAKDKNEAFRHLAWYLPAGVKYEAQTKYGKEIVEVLKGAAEKLGIDPAEALAADGNLSERDKALLSSIEIEVEPSDEPSDEPTEEPSEEPTDVKVSTLDELVAALAEESDKVITLESNIGLSRTIIIGNGVNRVLDLNGNQIINTTEDYVENEDGTTVTSNVDGITVVKGGQLTIEDSANEGKVSTVSGGGSPIYANGGTVVINGGLFETLNRLDSGKGFSLVYADNGGQVVVNDGFFYANGEIQEESPYFQYYLNCKDGEDGKGALITVKGGYYFNWDPTTHDAITKRPEYPEVVVEEGFKVEKLEDSTFRGLTGTWFHVVEE